ncbi:pyridoxal phosphate phosphatase PHOSPHO2-like [Watersipora subatra]|uniref:pyridoxal phosphate phosphatase PHOSPHO2-like n=1 Tax=Watersipora subatra TaxID=2589382 RepID=UPI00355B29AC
MAGGPKSLVVLDFDYTIVETCYDQSLVKLLAVPLPDDLKALYLVETSWTAYMNGLLSFLHEQGITSDVIKQTVLESRPVKGMMELFQHFAQGQYEVIILSDANQLFIEWLLKDYGIYEQVEQVYANPVKCSDGKLIETYYHENQDWCSLSSKNLCKGKALKDHVEQKRASGVTYSRIIYIGDGENDYCPTLELSTGDYVFARKSFDLERKIKDNISEVAAKVFYWESGKEILQALQDIQQ